MNLRKYATFLFLPLLLAACNFDGGVEQGRCVAYDEKAHTVTLVVDEAIDQHNPRYTGAIDTFHLPTDPRDMGPAPEAGGLLMIDPEKKEALIYDPAEKKTVTVALDKVEVTPNLDSRDASLKGRVFPEINKETHSVTVYSPRLRELITFTPANPDYFKLPDFVWKYGDEARIAFRNEKRGEAIRFMNVSKTNIFTR